MTVIEALERALLALNEKGIGPGCKVYDDAFQAVLSVRRIANTINVYDMPEREV